MALTSIREKYQKNLAKDSEYRSSQKPKCRPIGNKQSFWQSALEKGKPDKIQGQIKQGQGLQDKKIFWSTRTDEKCMANGDKSIKTFQNKKVEDLSRTWHEIAQGSSNKGFTAKKPSFLGFTGTRINVTEMSEKYQDSRAANETIIKTEDMVQSAVEPKRRENQRDKEQQWEETVTKAKQSANKADMSNRPAAETDVECLCKAIYDHGERYMDGTAAINFTELRMAFRGSGNLINAITKAKKFGIIDHDGDQAYALEADDVVVLLVPVFKVVQAFQEMRDRHPDIFQ